MLSIDDKLPEAKGITGLLLTLSSVNASAKAKQIEEVVKSTSKARRVTVRGGVHNGAGHAAFPPVGGAAGPWWFGIDLCDGDDTPETIHLYVDPVDVKLLLLRTAGHGCISVESKLRPGIDWY